MALTFLGHRPTFLVKFPQFEFDRRLVYYWIETTPSTPILSESHHVVSVFSIVFKISKIQAEALVAQASNPRYLGG